jgi:sulfur carrier protein
MSSIRQSARSVSNDSCRRARPSDFLEKPMMEATIRVNGESEPLVAVTLEGLVAEKAIDTGQRGIAVALNGAVVPRAAWRETALRPGDSVEIVRARQGG